MALYLLLGPANPGRRVGQGWDRRPLRPSLSSTRRALKRLAMLSAPPGEGWHQAWRWSIRRGAGCRCPAQQSALACKRSRPLMP